MSGDHFQSRPSSTRVTTQSFDKHLGSSIQRLFIFVLSPLSRFIPPSLRVRYTTAFSSSSLSTSVRCHPLWFFLLYLQFRSNGPSRPSDVPDTRVPVETSVKLRHDQERQSGPWTFRNTFGLPEGCFRKQNNPTLM